MATYTVKQNDGDFPTLADALADPGTTSGDTISIEGTWTEDDTSDATISDANITITTDSDSRHPGYYDTSQNHYRLVVGSRGNPSALEQDSAGGTIDGLAIKSTSTDSSDECIRNNTTGAITIKNCIIWNSAGSSDQDGIYPTNYSQGGQTANITNCIIYGAYRAGISLQFGSSSDVATININSCTVWGNGDGTDADDGGIYGYRADSSTFNIFNTICVGNPAGDYAADSSATTWNISNSMDSDNSIAGVLDSGSNNYASYTATTNTNPGAGNYVIFQNLTESTADLRLVDDSDNDAVLIHSVDTAHGLSITTGDGQYDILGNERGSNGATPNEYDVGAHAVSDESGVSPVTITPAGSATIAISGQQATVLVPHIITPTAQADIEISGQSASVSQAYNITPAAQADIAVTGQQAELAQNYRATPTAQADIAITGQQVSAVQAYKALPTAPAEVAIEGQQAIVDVPTNQTVTPTAQADISVTGQSATVVQAFKVAPTAPADIAFSGQVAQVFAPHIVTPTAPAEIAIEGQQADISSPGIATPSGPATLTISGQSATVVQAFVTTPTAPAEVVIAGQSASATVAATVIPTAPAELTISGQSTSVTVSGSYTVTPTVGTIAIEGQQPPVPIVKLKYLSDGLIALEDENKKYLLPGIGKVVLEDQSQPVTVVPDVGSLFINGQNVAKVFTDLTATPTAPSEIAISGQAASVIEDTSDKTVTPTVGTIAIAGQQVFERNRARVFFVGIPVIVNTVVEAPEPNVVTPSVGALEIAGGAVTVAGPKTITPINRLILIRGQAARAVSPLTVTPDVASIPIVGASVSITVGAFQTPSASATLTVSGQSTSLKRGLKRLPQSGTIAIEGKQLARNAVPTVGTIEISGNPARSIPTPTSSSINIAGQVPSVVIQGRWSEQDESSEVWTEQAESAVGWN